MALDAESENELPAPTALGNGGFAPYDDSSENLGAWRVDHSLHDASEGWAA